MLFKFMASSHAQTLETNLKGLPSARGFIVEQNTVAGIHAVGLSIVLGNPVSIKLGNRIRRTGIKRGLFLLLSGRF